MEVAMKSSNYHQSREDWLRAATNELRSYFTSCGYDLPEKIRFAIAFPSTGRKGKRLGECWHSSTSGDESYEIFIRADQFQPAEVLGVLVKELVHTVLPVDAGHGKKFKDAALKIGLQAGDNKGGMRQAKPGPLLQKRLGELADSLGPLPHARLNIEQQPMTALAIDRPKKQGTRMLKAECEAKDCGYVVRIAASHVNKTGKPHCPKHGEMAVEQPNGEAEEQESGAMAESV
jgi:hypothetical protein